MAKAVEWDGEMRMTGQLIAIAIDGDRFAAADEDGTVAHSHNCARPFLAMSSAASMACDRDALWEAVNAGRMRDTALLDMLVRLARYGEKPELRPLDVVADAYIGKDLVKTWQDSCSNALASLPSALRGVTIIAVIYKTLAAAAAALEERYRDEPLPDAVAHFGLLSEVVQVKGSVALAQLTCNGIFVDTKRLQDLRAKVGSELASCVERLSANPEYASVLQRSETGELVMTEGGLRPALNTAALKAALLKAAEAVGSDNGFAVPKTADGDVETSIWKWKNFCKFHPFVQNWFDLEHNSKLLQFLEGVAASLVVCADGQVAVFPEYFPLTRNGRASSRNPNIQTTPAIPGFREIFVPPRGCQFLTVDYTCIELCTLASVCESRYEFTALGDVIREGKDPHAFTASFFSGLGYEEFLALKSSADAAERARFVDMRQKAKVVNFGIAAGWSPRSLREYALSNYGVEMSAAEARLFRERLVTDIYPEIGLYLYEDGMQILARALCASLHDTWDELWGHTKTPSVANAVRCVVRGKYERKDGTSYERSFVDRVIGGLHALALRSRGGVSPEVVALIDAARRSIDDVAQRRAVGARLHEALYKGDCLTLTGRVRAGATFTKARNTPFAGLAADGAKLAMWNLCHSGYHLCCFVHDEIVIALPRGCDLQQEKRTIEQICCQSMQQLTGTVPITCKCGVSDCWTKEPTPIVSVSE